MNLSLTPELEKLVHKKVQSGRYASAADVLREALGLLEERDRMEAWRQDEIRARIAAGMRSLRAGEGEDGETAFDRLEALIELDARREDG